MSLFKKSFILMVLIAAIAVGSLGAWKYWSSGDNDNRAAAASAQEWAERVFVTEEIVTNLYEGGWIKARFAIETDSAQTKNQLESAAFQTQSVILKILSQSNREQLIGADGLLYLETEIKERLNNALREERVRDVYTIDRLIQ